MKRYPSRITCWSFGCPARPGTGPIRCATAHGRNTPGRPHPAMETNRIQSFPPSHHEHRLAWAVTVNDRPGLSILPHPPYTPTASPTSRNENVQETQVCRLRGSPERPSPSRKAKTAQGRPRKAHHPDQKVFVYDINSETRVSLASAEKTITPSSSTPLIQSWSLVTAMSSSTPWTLAP